MKVVAHVCNASIWETDEEFYSECRASLGRS